MFSLAPPFPSPQLGSLVRITMGPLAGLTGLLLEFPPSGRCLVDVSSLAPGLYLRIDVALLEFVTEE